MNAALVCVDYADLLAITLPYNRHHFKHVLVITTKDDTKTCDVASNSHCHVYRTNTFYANGADFNKWAALEEGLDWFGRTGWLCLLDADVLWPRVTNLARCLQSGCLHTPRRRIQEDITKPVPPEEQWANLPLYNEIEFAGYSQIFHCDDPTLGAIPWHQTNWRHAGGADSFFQSQWPPDKRIRPDFEVLHLGRPGVNWCGRATPYTDGKVPEEMLVRTDRLTGYMLGRIGKRGIHRHKHEKF